MFLGRVGARSRSQGCAGLPSRKRSKAGSGSTSRSGHSLPGGWSGGWSRKPVRTRINIAVLEAGPVNLPVRIRQPTRKVLADGPLNDGLETRGSTEDGPPRRTTSGESAGFEGIEHFKDQKGGS